MQPGRRGRVATWEVHKGTVDHQESKVVTLWFLRAQTNENINDQLGRLLPPLWASRSPRTGKQTAPLSEAGAKVREDAK